MDSIKMVAHDNANDVRRSVHDPVEKLENDLLNREQIASLVLRRLHADDCPPAIGLYGNWGTGKTSVLNFISQLDSAVDKKNDKKLFIITIDAWLYEGTGNLFVPIVSNLKGLMGSENAEKLGVSFKRVAMISSLVLLNMGVGKLGLDVDDIKKHYDDSADDTFGASFGKIVNDIEETRSDFSKLIEAVKDKKAIERLVICVDNLDRCSPESAIHLLSSIKNFVNNGDCVWVFSMDADIITKYLDAQYTNIAMYGNNYLDKIIPEQYHLSLSPTKDFSRIRDLLKFASGEESQEEIPLRRGKLPEIPRILVPRRLIKSARKFAEYYEETSSRGVHPETIFALILLYHGWPEFYERLSFTSKEYIRAMLENFFPSKEESKTMPLEERFSEDRDLTYFLRFLLSYDDDIQKLDQKINEVILGVENLRRVGLP